MPHSSIATSCPSVLSNWLFLSPSLLCRAIIHLTTYLPIKKPFEARKPAELMPNVEEKSSPPDDDVRATSRWPRLPWLTKALPGSLSQPLRDAHGLTTFLRGNPQPLR